MVRNTDDENGVMMIKVFSNTYKILLASYNEK